MSEAEQGSRMRLGMESTEGSNAKYKFLTAEWFAETLRTADWLQPTPGVNVRQQVVLTDNPRGTIKYFEEIRDGKLKDIFKGVGARPDVTVTMAYEDYRQLYRENISSDQLPNPPRIEGNTGVVKLLVPIRRTEAFARHRSHMRDVTQWF